MKIIYFFNEHRVISFIIIFIIILMVLYNHLIFNVYIYDKKLKINLNIKVLFNLIDIKVQIYPPKKKKKNKKKHFNIAGLLKLDYSSILNLVKRLKIVELYSALEFGGNNFYLTIYVDAFVNIIYGNIANIINSKKLYLNIKPNFIENKIGGEVRLHIKFNIIDIILMLPIIIKNIKHIHYVKEGDMDECNKFDSKHYGDNIGNY